MSRILTLTVSRRRHGSGQNLQAKTQAREERHGARPGVRADVSSRNIVDVVQRRVDHGNDKQLPISLGSVHYRQPLAMSMSMSALLTAARVPRHGPGRLQVHPSPLTPSLH